MILNTPQRVYPTRTWDWMYDEDHLWGDLNKEEEIRLKNILKGRISTIRD